MLLREKQQLGPAVLFFGCRHRNHDYIYESELTGAVEAGALSKLHVAFSRMGASKDYVQHHIEAQAGEGLRLSVPACVWRDIVSTVVYHQRTGSAKLRAALQRHQQASSLGSVDVCRALVSVCVQSSCIHAWQDAQHNWLPRYYWTGQAIVTGMPQGLRARCRGALKILQLLVKKPGSSCFCCCWGCATSEGPAVTRGLLYGKPG